MGADSLAENTENAQEFVCPTLQKTLFCIIFDTYVDPGSALIQKFYILVLDLKIWENWESNLVVCNWSAYWSLIPNWGPGGKI